MRQIVFSAALLLTLLAANPALAKTYFGMGGGYGGEYEVPSLSWGVGSTVNDHFVVGLDLMRIFSGRDGTNYVSRDGASTVATFREDEWGLALNFGPRVHGDFYIFGLGGATYQEATVVANYGSATVAKMCDDDTARPLYGLGLAWMPPSDGRTGILLKAQGDNRRGVSVMLGYTF